MPISRMLRLVLSLAFLEFFFSLSSSEKWLRALPQESPAGLSWNLTVSGDFLSNINYQCWFGFQLSRGAESVLSRTNIPTFKSSISKPSSSSALICRVPVFDYAESVGVLSIQNIDAGISISGPVAGSTPSLITFTAGWQSAEAVEGTGSCKRCSATDSSLVACNLAKGGGRLRITGFGFDATASDYACKFVCSSDINPACDDQTFVQGPIPNYPTSLFAPSARTLYCSTPLWPFDAHRLAGRTRLVIEKGGVRLPLLPAQSSACLDYFDFLEGWDYQAVRITALATAGSAVLTITGYGFDPRSTNHTCLFAAFPYARGTPATVLSSLAITCPSPAWDLPIPPDGADVFIHAVSCAGARGVGAACDAGSKVLANQADSAGKLFLAPAAASLSPSASTAAVQLVTILGGGFDPARYAYAVHIADPATGAAANVSVPAGNVTGGSILAALANRHFTPNVPCAVTVLQAGSPIAVTSPPPAGLAFAFVSEWHAYAAAGGTPGGTAAGGQSVTMLGSGFLPAAAPAGAGYACEFDDGAGGVLRSAPAAVLSPTALVCTTPPWGLTLRAGNVTLRLLKGAYRFPGPGRPFEFLASWDSWSSTAGPAGGGAELVVGGYGLDPAAEYQCEFAFSGGAAAVRSAPARARSGRAVACSTPAWGFGGGGRTALRLLRDGRPVARSRVGAEEPAAAAYEFGPGFSVSAARLELGLGQTGAFSFRPDTPPTGNVTVALLSSDPAVAAVASPFALTADGGMAGNAREARVRCAASGEATLSLAAAGANYDGRRYGGAVAVRCRGALAASPAASVVRPGVAAAVSVRLRFGPADSDGADSDGAAAGYAPASDIVVAVSAAGAGGACSAGPAKLTFPRGVAAAMTATVTCFGPGPWAVTLRTVDVGTELLFQGVSTAVALFAAPAFTVTPARLVLRPGASGAISLALAAPPSLRTTVVVESLDPAVSVIPPAAATLVFAAGDMGTRAVAVVRTGPGRTALRARARSPGLLEQLSAGCGGGDAARCTAAFAQRCDFRGYGGANRTLWALAMRSLSLRVGVADCSAYEGCLRVSCCASAPALSCVSAAVADGCRADWVPPPLLQNGTLEAGWGWLPGSNSSAQYLSWVSGIDCRPYLPCAWHRCFPGGGNYDFAVAEDILVDSLPGFAISPQAVNLKQGFPSTVLIEPEQAPTTPVTVTISLIPDSVAYVRPSQLYFQGKVSQNFSILWKGSGMASLRISVSGSAGNYTTLDQLLFNAVSSSPAFAVYVVDETNQSLSIDYRQGTIIVPVQDGKEPNLWFAPMFVPRVDFLVNISGPPSLISIFPSTFQFLAGSSAVQQGRITLHDPREAFVQLSISASVQSNLSQDLYILSSGTGYTSGNISIEGYGGSGFSGTFTVGVQKWDFYCDPDSVSPRTGSNYSYGGRKNFSGPVNGTTITVGSCFRSAQPISSDWAGQQRCIYNHEGLVVPGCSPHITYDIVAGRVLSLRFDNASCTVTGITCQMHLNGFGSGGFSGYFQTGITNTKIISRGFGYVCDWACITRLSSTQQSVYENSRVNVQACLSTTTNCSGEAEQPQVIFGDLSVLKSNILIHRVASTTIAPSTAILQVYETQTITVFPNEISTGNVTFYVKSNSSQLSATGFFFSFGDGLQDVKVFNVTHLGGPAEVVELSIYGLGEGNFDGYSAKFLVRLMPGILFLQETVLLQQKPGFSIITFFCNTPPSKNTLVNVMVESDFGLDGSLDSYGKKIMQVNQTIIILEHSMEPLTLVLIHGGADGSLLENRVSGSAYLWFAVSDPESNYNGVSTERSRLLVSVLPGFESNIKETYRVAVQKGTSFVLSLKLDHYPLEDVELEMTLSNYTLATVQGRFKFSARDQGPLNVSIHHAGRVGTVKLSIRSVSTGGNYAHVFAENYLSLDMLPGFTFSQDKIQLQHQEETASFFLGLDTQPTADTVISIKSSDPSIFVMSPSISFSAAKGISPVSSDEAVTVLWVNPGTATLTFLATSPGGNYDRVSSGSVEVVCFRGLTISASTVLVQKGNSAVIFVSTPTKPAVDTIFSFTSNPLGIVSTSQPIILPQGTNETFSFAISYLTYGSATVRISAQAAGDAYDGVSHDILASTMPGFVFSISNITLYSCFYRVVCEATFSISPDQIPTEDMTVQITTSFPVLIEIHPPSIKFSAKSGLSSIDITVRYKAAGISCLSFAASSLGNYDQVFSSGVTVRTMPDLIVDSAVMFFPLGATPRNSPDFYPAAPIIYVQNASYTVVSISPSLPPTADIVIAIDGFAPLLTVSTSVLKFQGGSVEPQTVAITSTGLNGDTVLHLTASGGNYDGAMGPDMVVKALPSFSLSAVDLAIPFHGKRSITFSPSNLFVVGGPVNVSIQFDEIGFATATPPYIQSYQSGDVKVAIEHLKTTVNEERIGSSPYTYARLTSVSPASSYNHVEQVIRLLLLPSGFDLSSSELHIQKYRDSSLEKPSYNLDCQLPFPQPLQRNNGIWNTFCGSVRLYLNPNDEIRNITRVTMQSSSPLVTIVSQAYPNNLDAANGEDPASLLIFYPGDGQKYFEIFHKGEVGVSYLTISAGGVGFLSPFPEVKVITHGAFAAPSKIATIQRQSVQTISLAPTYPPDEDTLIRFSSSNESAAMVLNDIFFSKGDISSKNLSIFNINPGIALLSFQGQSLGFAYGGAAVINGILVECLQGFLISDLILRIQSHPYNGGLANMTLKPDYPPTLPVVLTVISSDTSYIEVVTPLLVFQADSAVEKTAIFRNIRSGTSTNLIRIQFLLTTDVSSNYFGVVLPQVEAIPLGSFTVSTQSVVVQKGERAELTIAPNIPPDDDVLVQISVSNSSVIINTLSVQFLAQKLDAQVISIEHISAGTAMLSFEAFSSSGNYNGSRLKDAVFVSAVHGFSAYFDFVGEHSAPASEISVHSKLVVQMQPTSPFSFAAFYFRPDILVDQDTYVTIKSSNISNVFPLTDSVVFRRNQVSLQKVVIQHGGISGNAYIFFNVTSGLNYAGIASGRIHVLAMPGFVFSRTRIDVQRTGFASFLISLDTAPTGDTTIFMISSDDSVATVNSSISLNQSNLPIAVTVMHHEVGTIAISFFASGGNYDGVSWTNGVVAACRPGFILIPSSIAIPYGGVANFTLQPDTEPSADTIITIMSSQPTKATAVESTITIKGGDLSPVIVTVKSRCSQSPGNCARAGSTAFSVKAQSNGGNYDGVESVNFVVASVLSPLLLLSSTAGNIQLSDGFATLIVTPTLVPNVDTTLKIVVQDRQVCIVNSSVVLNAGTTSPKTITFYFVGVGETSASVFVQGPESSMYADIDPFIVILRSLASFQLSSQNVTVQPDSTVSLELSPSVEIAADVIVSLSMTAPEIAVINPSTFVLSPPRTIVGLDVLPSIGMEVVRSEKFQVWPRLGLGRIIRILNDNMNIVTVNWTMGAGLQENYAGYRGEYMLALYLRPFQIISITYQKSGTAEASVSSRSADPNYHGVEFNSAIHISSPPRFIAEPKEMTIQYGETKPCVISPGSQLTEDIGLIISEPSMILNETQIKSSLVNLTQYQLSFPRVISDSNSNSRLVNVSCKKAGATELRFQGQGGTYAATDYFGLSVLCLPGFLFSKTVIDGLSVATPLASFTVTPMVIPTHRTTVMISSNGSELVRYTNRLIFMPFVLNDEQTIIIEYAGQLASGDVFLSLEAFGGNYENVVALAAVQITVKGPSLIVPTKPLVIHPESSLYFSVNLDTSPSAVTYIQAISSDPSVVTVSGPQHPAVDTSDQLFQLQHVRGGNATIHFSTSALLGSTYGLIPSAKGQVHVQALKAGFIFSARQISIKPYSNFSLSFGLDSTPDSTVIVYIIPHPSGIVNVFPPTATFFEGGRGQVSTFLLSWVSPGSAGLLVKSEGGLYQYISIEAPVSITSLPYIPGEPIDVIATAVLPLAMSVTWNFPAETLYTGSAFGFKIEASLSPTFQDLELAAVLGNASNPWINKKVSFNSPPFSKTMCLFIRIFASNAAGFGPPGRPASGCIQLVDLPPTPVPNSILMMGNGKVGISWNYLFVNETLDYRIDVLGDNSSVLNSQIAVYQSSALSVAIPLDSPLQLQLRSVRVTGAASRYLPTASFQFEGPALQYYVPFNFRIMPTHLESYPGNTSQFALIPDSSPTVDFLISIWSSDPNVATVTDHLDFVSGSAAAQNVIVYHLHPGYTNISFSAIGGIYTGLSILVTVRTLLNIE